MPQKMIARKVSFVEFTSAFACHASKGRFFLPSLFNLLGNFIRNLRGGNSQVYDKRKERKGWSSVRHHDPNNGKNRIRALIRRRKKRVQDQRKPEHIFLKTCLLPCSQKPFSKEHRWILKSKT